MFNFDIIACNAYLGYNLTLLRVTRTWAIKLYRAVLDPTLGSTHVGDPMS